MATIDRKELYKKVWEIRTPSIRSLIYQYTARVNELLKKFQSNASTVSDEDIDGRKTACWR